MVTQVEGRGRRARRSAAALVVGAGLIWPGMSSAVAADEPAPSASVSEASPTCLAAAGDTSTVVLNFDNSSSDIDAVFDVAFRTIPDEGGNHAQGFDVAAGATKELPVTVSEGTHQFAIRYLIKNDDGTYQPGIPLADETRTIALCEPEPPETPEPTDPPSSPAPEVTPPAPPAAEAGPLDSSALTDANRGAVTVPSTSTLGADITVGVGTAYAGQSVSAWIYSTPTALGVRTVSANGSISVTIPASLAAGTHRIAVLDSAGALIGWDEINLSAGTNVVPKAATGLDEGASSSAGVTSGVAALAAAGTLAVVALRRRGTSRA